MALIDLTVADIEAATFEHVLNDPFTIYLRTDKPSGHIFDLYHVARLLPSVKAVERRKYLEMLAKGHGNLAGLSCVPLTSIAVNGVKTITVSTDLPKVVMVALRTKIIKRLSEV